MKQPPSPLCRPHPIFIYYDAKKWIPLLVVWLLRALLDPGAAARMAEGAAGELMIGVGLAAYSVVKWRTAYYRFGQRMELTHGLLVRKHITVMPDDTASVAAIRSPLMAATGSVKVQINTAGRRKRSDVTLYLRAQTASRLLPLSRIRDGYRATLASVLMMAISGSNTAFGMLTLAPAFARTGALLQSEVPAALSTRLTRLLHVGLPPLMEQAAAAAVWGWILSFGYTVLRFYGFRASRENGRLHISCGWPGRQDVWIPQSKITAVELRQTLYMRLLSLYTVSITAAGYGREKGSRPVAVPAAGTARISAAIHQLFPEYPMCAASLRPRKDAAARYMALPCAAVAAALVPVGMGGYWRVCGGLCLLFAGWWLTVRALSFRHSGFGIGCGAVTVRYERGLSLVTVQIPLEVADAVLIHQTKAQQKTGLCTAEVRCFGEGRRRHRVRGLDAEATKDLVNRALRS